MLKNQGSILYLLGYLVYIQGLSSPGKLTQWFIFAALLSFGISLLTDLLCRNAKSAAAVKLKTWVTTATDSAGGFFTLLFALIFIPNAHYIETHLALFGLLIMTFLASRDILPGITERREVPTTGHGKQNPTIDLPVSNLRSAGKHP